MFSLLPHGRLREWRTISRWCLFSRASRSYEPNGACISLFTERVPRKDTQGKKPALPGSQRLLSRENYSRTGSQTELIGVLFLWV